MAIGQSPEWTGSGDREAHLARWQGLMQADAYSGFNRVDEPGRRPGPILEVACWAHARRYFFDLARRQDRHCSRRCLLWAGFLWSLRGNGRLA
jgi:hypothetical protein